MQPPDPQVILERGRNARELIASATFQSVVDDLSSYHLRALVAAPPGDTGRDAREHHHLLHYALSEIAAQLTGYVAAADEIERVLAEGDDDE